MENINPEMVRNRMNRKTHIDIIPRMFLSAAVAMIFTRLTSVAAQIITSERHSGIEFFTEEEIAEARDTFQRSAIAGNISRSFLTRHNEIICQVNCS